MQPSDAAAQVIYVSPTTGGILLQFQTDCTENKLQNNRQGGAKDGNLNAAAGCRHRSAFETLNTARISCIQ
jgi:hypothetical protein